MRDVRAHRASVVSYVVAPVRHKVRISPEFTIMSLRYTSSNSLRSTCRTVSFACGVLFALGCGKHFPVSEPSTPEVAAKTSAGRCLAPEKPMAKVAPGNAATGNVPSAACVERARAMVAKLTLRQKLGQMMQPDRGTVRSLDELRQHGYGSIL